MDQGFQPERDRVAGEGPDEEAALGSCQEGAGDQQVVSGLQVGVEHHLPLVGVAVCGRRGGLVQHPCQVEALLLYLVADGRGHKRH